MFLDNIALISGLLFMVGTFILLICSVLLVAFNRLLKFDLQLSENHVTSLQKGRELLLSDNERLRILNTGLQEALIEKNREVSENDTKKEHKKLNNNLYCPDCGSLNIYVKKNEPTHLECKCNDCNKLFKVY